MTAMDDVPSENKEKVEEAVWEALDLLLGGDLTRRFAEGVTAEERLEAIRALEQVNVKLKELTENQDDTPPGLVDVDAACAELIEWARETGESQEEQS